MAVSPAHLSLFSGRHNPSETSALPTEGPFFWRPQKQMLFDIFVTLPLLLMTDIAWYIRSGIGLVVLLVLFAVVMGALGFYTARQRGHSTVRGVRPERRRSRNRSTRFSA